MASPVPQRTLGKNGPKVPALGFGAMGLSINPKPDAERFRVLDAAHALGATHWDSADIYLDSEDLIGEWFKRTGKRDEVGRPQDRLWLIQGLTVG